MRDRSEKGLLVVFGLAAVAGFVYLATVGNGRTYAFDEWRFLAYRQSWSIDSEIFRLLVLLIHVGNVACVGLLVHRRHGALPGTVAATAVMFLAAGAQNIIWGFQIGMAGSVLFFLLSVLGLDLWRERGRSWTRPTATHGRLAQGQWTSRAVDRSW